MLYPFEHEYFQGRSLAVSTGGFFQSACLFENDEKINGKRSKFIVNDNQGVPREIKIKTNFLDPVPKIEIDGTTIQLARSLAWYEYLWMGLPIMLIFAGGALGAMFGVGATYSSGRIFRSERKASIKYLLSGVVSISAVTAYFVFLAAIQYLINTNRDKTSQEYLMEVAEITNKDLPKMLDDQTILVKLDGLEGVLVYYYRLANVNPGQLSETYLVAKLRPIVTRQTCATPATREDFLENEVTLRYVYSDKYDGEIAQFDVKISDCN